MSDSGRTPWPETTVFWGAGATAALGMPVTADSGRSVGDPWRCRLTTGRQTAASSAWQHAKVFDGIDDRVADLLVALGDDVKSHPAELTVEEKQAAARLFPSLDDRSPAVGASSSYVGSMTGTACGRSSGFVLTPRVTPDFLRDLFNILDMHILAGKGFHVPPSGDRADDGTPLSDASTAARRQKRLDDAAGIDVPRRLAQVPDGQGAGIGNLRPGSAMSWLSSCRRRACGLRLTHHIDSRRFYLFSYAVISMNFDPILLWLLFNSHKDLNDASPPYVGTPAAPMKLFHDHGQVLALRPVDVKRGTDIWYPFTEAAAQRLNDPKYRSIGEFVWESSTCLTVAWAGGIVRIAAARRSTWAMNGDCDSETLLPPCVIALPGVNHQARSGPRTRRPQTWPVRCCPVLVLRRDDLHAGHAADPSKQLQRQPPILPGRNSSRHARLPGEHQARGATGIQPSPG